MELPTPGGRGERRGRERLPVPALTVLYHPDLRRVGDRAFLPTLAGRGVVRLSRLEPGFAPPGETVHPDARSPLGDPYLSRTPLLLAGLEDEGVRLVAEGCPTPMQLDGEPVEGEVLLPPARLERGAVLLLAGRVVLLLHHLRRVRGERGGAAGAPFGLVGESDAMVDVGREIRRVADLDLPVLLRGATGTGKELAARALHRSSRRRDAAFVAVNLAAVPASLAASELFGAVKGAYTGSVQAQAGFFERADGGTLFLDEVGEAPVEVQAALLRVLESGEIQRVGSQAAMGVDVRLLAATDQDLEAAVAEGRFRSPLLHRLAAYEVVLPALQERRDDFGRLLVHFLRRELTRVGEEHRLVRSDPAEDPWLPASIVERLARHDWPGNVRQLENVVRQLVVAGRGAERIRVTPQVERLLREAEGRPASPPGGSGASDDGPAAGRGPSPATQAPDGDETARNPTYRSPSEVTEDEMVAALRAHHWEVKPAAEALNVSRPSLYNLIARSDRVRKVADLSDGEVRAAHRRHGGDLEAMARELEVSRSGLRQRLASLDPQ